MRRTFAHYAAVLTAATILFTSWPGTLPYYLRSSSPPEVLDGSPSTSLPALQGDKAVEHLKQQDLYSSLQEALAAASYNVEPETNIRPGPQSIYLASNPAQRFSARFSPEGLRIADSRGSDWNLGMKLTGYGYGDYIIVVAPGRLRTDENQIEIDHSSQDRQSPITQWYINKAEGLEQGFTIAQRPSLESQGEWLSVRLTIDGDMRGELTEDGQAVLLRRAESGAVVRYDKLAAWDSEGRVLESRMSLQGGELRLEVYDEGASYPVTIDPVFTQQTKLTPGDGEVHDGFGASVAISGETAVVGAPGHKVGDNFNQGSAYVFVRTGTSWVQQAKLTASDGAAYDQFGVSVAISGETVAVGAPGTPARNTVRNSAYIFLRVGSAWSQQAKLTASDGAASDQFGISVAVSGETVMVGANLDDVGANDFQGSAYIFVRSGTIWTQQAKLTASDGAALDQFGRSVSISGETAVVGAFGDDIGVNSFQGSAYVFVRSGTSWVQQAKLTASDGAALDRFGISVAVSGETVVVGVDRTNLSFPGNAAQGSAYVFVRNGTTWSQQAKLTSSDGVKGDGFGHSVAISGEIVVVGALLSNVDSNNFQGSAYVFVRAFTTWREQEKLTANDGAASDIFFSFSVAISGETAVVGAIGNEDRDVGSAYAFVCGETANWNQQAQTTARDGAAGDDFGASVAISGETAVIGAFHDDVGTNTDQGSAYVFVRIGSRWRQQAKLAASDGEAFDLFGASVAISGETVVVSARQDVVGANDFQGSAYVFVRSGTIWTQQAKLTASDGGADDFFGLSVAISGETVVVGALFDDVGARTDQGSAYIFVRNGITWSQQAKLTASDGAAFDGFGFSVAIDRETAVVGATGDANGQGSAYVFVRSGTTWSQQRKLTASDGEARDNFGSSVAISGETVAVGASQDNVGGDDFQGSAYVFIRRGTAWSQQAKLIAGDGSTSDRFGRSLAISGETLVVGATGDRVGGNVGQGSAYVFVRTAAWSPQIKLTASDGAAGDNFGASVALSGKTLIIGAPIDDVGANINQGSAYIFTNSCLQEVAGQPPDSGINLPADGSSQVGQTQQFLTTCSDPDGWRDIHSIDFKITKGEGHGKGESVALWVQFDQDFNLIRFFDPDTRSWSEGSPGQHLVLSSRLAELHLANTLVQGSGPTGPSVQISWEVVFKDAAVRNNYKQLLRIEDDAGLSTSTDVVGRWSITR